MIRICDLRFTNNEHFVLTTGFISIVCILWIMDYGLWIFYIFLRWKYAYTINSNARRNHKMIQLKGLIGFLFLVLSFVAYIFIVNDIIVINYCARIKWIPLRITSKIIRTECAKRNSEWIKVYMYIIIFTSLVSVIQSKWNVFIIHIFFSKKNSNRILKTI